MFAGCIENGEFAYGERLKAIHNSGNGLAGIKPKTSAIWDGGFNATQSCTLIEQPVVIKGAGIVKDSDEWTIYAQSNIVVVGWLRIDNRSELKALLNIIDNGDELCDRALVARSYRQWGESFTKRLVGDFSLVVVDLVKGQAILVRDHFGVRPFYYCEIDGGLIFASSIRVVEQLCGERLSISSNWVIKYLYGASADWVETNFNEVYKVPPARQITYRDSTLNEHCYFSFDSVKPIENLSSEDHVKEYRRLLSQAVKCRVSDIEKPIASELTGGLDSSTITLLASQCVDKPKERLLTYAYITNEYEKPCIDSVNNHADMCRTEVITNDHSIIELESISLQFLSFTGQPQEVGNASGHTSIYKEASQRGAIILLSGFGGDEFVTTYGSPVKVELFVNKQWRLWLSCFPGNNALKAARGLRWVYQYFFSKQHLETANNLRKDITDKFNNVPTQIDLELKEKIFEGVLQEASYDAPYKSINEFLINNRWSPRLTARLEQCSLAAASYGVEYRWPLLDSRLVCYFLATPNTEKYGPEGVSRYLHRRAVVDLLPSDLIYKDKSMGKALPHKKRDITLLFKHLSKARYKELPKPLKNYVNPNAYESIRNKLSKSVDRREARHSFVFMKRVRWLLLWLQNREN